MNHLGLCYKSICIGILLVVLLVVGVYPQSDFEKNDYALAIEEFRYQDAYDILNKKDKTKLNILESDKLQSLEFILSVDKYQWPKSTLAMAEDEVDPPVLTQVNRILKMAKSAYLDNKIEATKHLLIHSLYIYPDFPKSVYFLTTAFKMSPGTYTVEDQIKLLIKRSNNYFYGGNYIKAAEDLEVVVMLERENPVVFEKLGSSYYMMNQKQKAVNQWVTALFYNPGNKKLENMVDMTRQMIMSEMTEVSAIDEARQAKVVIEDPQIMGVFKRQSEAFELMKSLREKGLAVAITENESGRWIVQVSRKELQALNSTTEVVESNDELPSEPTEATE